jgi:hypothetical protein
MPKGIGRSISIALRADTKPFGKSLTDAERRLNRFKNSVKMVSTAVAASFAAIAAGALVFGKMAVDAAIEDQKAQVKLARTIRNNTKGRKDNTAAIEKSITAIGRQVGIADDKLRPAFSKLIIATKSVSKSQKLMRTAMDISATTTEDLDTVTSALAKSYLGNNKSLGALGLGFSKAELKAMTFEQIIAKITKTTKGAAAAQGNTLAVQIDKLKVAFNEFMESAGMKLLPLISKALKFISDEVQPFIDRISKGFNADQNGIKTFTDNAYALGGALGMDKAYNLGQALRDTSDAIGKMLGNLSGKGAEGASTLDTIAGALTNLANAITTITDAFSAYINLVKSPLAQKLLGIASIPLKSLVAGAGVIARIPGVGGDGVRASGGPVRKGASYLVGEMGPERFVPNQSGRIISAGKTAGMGGNTFILNGIVDADSARRSIERVLQNSTRRLGPVNLAGSGI